MVRIVSGYISVKTNIYRLIYLDHLTHVLDHLLATQISNISTTNMYKQLANCAYGFPKDV